MSELSFGRYEPLFRIAAGGMAEVYAARIRGEAGFEKLVAVKRMLPHLADDAEFVAMFLDEGRLAANIASPHVVSTIDLGRSEDGSLYIVMDLVVGVPLTTLIRAAAKQQRALPVPIACEILAQAATGLDDAHEARTPTGVHLGIVHRDVSPQNVLVGVDGRTRVVDFGVARAVLRQSHTSTGTLKGKFGYFSPEQAAARELDRRSDVFALGIVAWETLLARRLFESENPLETIKRVRSMPILRPSEVRPEVSEEVTNVVMRALCRERDMRWESAGEFAAALRTAIGARVTSREITTVVSEMGGKAVGEMQGRIEAAMAGDHEASGPPSGPDALVSARRAGHAGRDQRVTKPLPNPSKLEETEQATPSGLPGHVADLPTLVKIAAPPEVIAPPPAIEVTPPPVASSSRWWVAGIAVTAVLALAIGVALASHTNPEPLATPLAVPDREPVPATVIVPIAPPPPTTTIAAAPPPSMVEPTVAPVVHSPRPTRVVPPPEPIVPVVHAPPPSVAPPVHETAPPPSSVTRAPEPSRVPPPHHPAGLAGDDAFDRGI